MNNIYFNEKIAMSKELYDGKDCGFYIEVANLYKKVFERYLCSVVDCKSVDDKIKNDVLGINTSSIDKSTLSPLKDYLNLKSLVNINYFFIEKLSIEDIDVFKKTITNKSGSYAELTDIVKKTYKDVLTNDNHTVILDDKTFFEDSVALERGQIRDDSVAFKLYYGIYQKQYTEKSEFLNRHKNIDRFINGCIEELKEMIHTKLGMNCDVLVETYIL